MSLINQMLRDLEARREEAARGLPNDVRSLPAAGKVAWLRLAVGTVAAGLLAAGGILWFRGEMPTAPTVVQTPKQAAPAPVPIAVAPAPIAPAPIAPPPPAPPLPETAPAPAPAPAAAPAPSAPDAAASAPKRQEEPAPRATSEIRERPAPAKARQAAPLPEAGLKVARTLSAPRENSARDTAGQVAPRASDGAGRIEKSMRQPTDRERAEEHHRKAMALLSQGRTEQAIAGLRASLREDAGYAQARLALAGVLIEDKRLDEAQALLQEGLSASPVQPALAVPLARIQVERGDLPGAAETLRKAAPAAGANGEFRGLQAAVLQRLGRHKDAIDEFRAALAQVPQAGVWWVGLGISLEAEQHGAQAREAYQRAKASGTLSQELSAFVDQKLRQLP